MLRIVSANKVRPISFTHDPIDMAEFQPGMIAQIVRTVDDEHILRMPKDQTGPFLVIDDVLGRPKVGPEASMPPYQYFGSIGMNSSVVTGKVTVWYSNDNYFITDQVPAPIETYYEGMDLSVTKTGYLVPPDYDEFEIAANNVARCIGVDKETRRIEFRLDDNKTQVEDILYRKTIF